MIGVSGSVAAHGPVVDGRADPVLDRMLEEAKQAVGERLHDEVSSRLGQVLRHPTGYYESRVRIELQGDDVAVTDQGVIYGPWLEGTSSRNSRTRFKGYASFRKATQEVQGDVPRITGQIVARHLGELE